jgi:hypothetical protein
LLVGISTSVSTLSSIGATLQVNEGTGVAASLLRSTDDVSGANLVFRKTRSTTPTGVTIVQNNDILGNVVWMGTDGSNPIQAASISAQVDGTPGTNDMPCRLVFATTADGASSPTERMRITSTGNVLVGRTTDNAGRLAVNADPLTTPGGRVALFASVSAGADSANECLGVVKTANDTTVNNVFQTFYINGGAIASGRINANGAGAVAFGSTSDVRLKENIIELGPQLDKICALRPVEFDYIESEGGGHQVGFIAQEVEQIYPDTISERADGMKMLTGWSKTEARLVKALQEAIAKIETLETKVAALEVV